MKHSKLNQSGFSTIVIVLLVLVAGGIAFAGIKVMDSDKTANRATDSTETTQLAQITLEDQKLLTQAKELKKIDFDLDGMLNSQDNDDDNDGQNDDADTDDDNDGTLDDEDDDQDNDGIKDDKDDESAQQTELQEGNN